MLKHTLPNWNDEKGVARLAGEIMAAWETNPFAEFAARCKADRASGKYTPRDDDDPPAEFFKFKNNEEAAIKAALDGDIAPLAALLLSEDECWMEPSTRQLMAEFMTGARNPKTGKAGPGRPKMTPEERRKINPIHRAADEVAVLQHRLHELYPTQKVTSVRERAIDLAVKRTGVPSGRLRQHLRRAKNDRRRISP
jgi:hypothetical protein